MMTLVERLWALAQSLAFNSVERSPIYEAADRIEQLEQALRASLSGNEGWRDIAREALEGK